MVPLGDRAAGEAGAPGSSSISAYLALLLQEIAEAPAGPPLSTVYLGGGTPSLLTPAQVGELLAALGRRYGLAPGAEVSLELDPASFDQRRLAGYLATGVNRVSLGGQSFDDGVLAGLGRRHRRRDLLEAIEWLQRARRDGDLASWSLDLIQAVPGQGRQGWRQQLRQAIALRPPHLSVYDLTIEPGTVFGRREARGTLELPDGDLAADLMEFTWQELTAAGYGHYEISNYALPGHASRHNRVYWSGAGWWGFGMGATSAPWGTRQARPRTREGYRQWLERQWLEQSHPPAAADHGAAGMPFDERLLVGLRRREGVHLGQLLRELEAGLNWQDEPDPRPLSQPLQAQPLEIPLPDQDGKNQGLQSQLLTQLRTELRQELEALLAPFRYQGLVVVEGERWRLSDPQGLALSNAVLREVLAWWEPWPQRLAAAMAEAAPPASAAGPEPPGSGPAAAAD